jgi:hypothetical protein
MTVRGTLVLAAVFAVLATYVFVTREPPAPAVEASAPALLPDPAEVTRVELQDGPAASRHVTGWEKPAIDDLVAALATLHPLDAVADAPSDPAVYGLVADAPRLRVLAGTRTVLALDIGSANPAGTAMYVRQLGQSRVLLVGALLRWELEKLRRVPSAPVQP